MLSIELSNYGVLKRQQYYLCCISHFLCTITDYISTIMDRQTPLKTLTYFQNLP